MASLAGGVRVVDGTNRCLLRGNVAQAGEILLERDDAGAGCGTHLDVCASDYFGNGARGRI